MSLHSTDQENRQFLRLPREVSVSVNRLEYPLTNAKAKPATAKNLSNNGICFTSPIEYKPNTLLDLKIELRGWQQHLHNVTSIIDTDTLSKPLTAIGEVMWSKKLSGGEGYEIGVYFKDIYEDDYRAFRKYLEKVTENYQS